MLIPSLRGEEEIISDSRVSLDASNTLYKEAPADVGFMYDDVIEYWNVTYGLGDRHLRTTPVFADVLNQSQIWGNVRKGTLAPSKDWIDLERSVWTYLVLPLFGTIDQLSRTERSPDTLRMCSIQVEWFSNWRIGHPHIYWIFGLIVKWKDW